LFFRKHVIEKSSIIWRVLPLVKINTRISETSCMHVREREKSVNKGQPLVWDVTVVDTLADSYVLKTSEVSGFAAEMACKRKHNKYRSIISSNYII
jgi:hypothetical protein